MIDNEGKTKTKLTRKLYLNTTCFYHFTLKQHSYLYPFKVNHDYDKDNKH
jgi:hypothetical protein